MQSPSAQIDFEILDCLFNLSGDFSIQKDILVRQRENDELSERIHLY